MKKILKILLSYALIPFIASIPGLVLALFGLYAVTTYLVPALVVLIYILFRKKIDMRFAAIANGVILLILLVCFTIMMLISTGNIEGVLMANFSWLIFPYAPVMLIYMLIGQTTLLYILAFVTYAVAFLVTAFFAKLKVKKLIIPTAVVVLCVIVSVIMYNIRPAVKYGGHGFKYMNGYSSTDFSDYMVYSKNSKLVTLDSEASFIIENEEDMPVMDGAEACYPLYAAFAKAVYKDIDKIESEWLKSTDNPYTNGKIVSFTNTIRAFDRLIYDEAYGGKIDMFFGARPSEYQQKEAAVSGNELEITPIGREAFVFFVEKHTPIDNLTSEQIRAIYHGDITNWSELGGNDQEIVAFQRPVNSGSQTMMEYFMGDVSLKEPKKFEKVSAMEGVISQVAEYNNESGAIGYTFRYFLEELNQEKDVKILSVDGVYPSLESIEDGTYPLVTDVCLITRKNDSNPNVQKMIDFICSDEGQKIVRETGYAGLSEKE